MSESWAPGSAGVQSLLVAITGASGAAYARRLLDLAAGRFDPLYLTLSATAPRVIQEELGLEAAPDREFLDRLLPGHPAAESIRVYDRRDFDAPFASGSAAPDAMAIVPCSMGTLGRIASGTSDDLICRAADVMLKERRRLILMIRETPLSLIHARNILSVTEAGATVMPASPGLYHRPESVDDLVDFMVFRLLDHLGLRMKGAPRWQTPG